MNTPIVVERKKKAGASVYVVLGVVCIGFGLLVEFRWLLLAWGVGATLIAWAMVPETTLVCGQCGNPITSRNVRICPTCRAALARK